MGIRDHEERREALSRAREGYRTRRDGATGVKRPRDPSRVAGRSIKIAGGSIIITPHGSELVHVNIQKGDAHVEMVISSEKARTLAAALTMAANAAD